MKGLIEMNDLNLCQHHLRGLVQDEELERVLESLKNEAPHEMRVENVSPSYLISAYGVGMKVALKETAPQTAGCYKATIR